MQTYISHMYYVIVLYALQYVEKSCQHCLCAFLTSNQLQKFSSLSGSHGLKFKCSMTPGARTILYGSRDGYQYEAWSKRKLLAASLQSGGNLAFTGENKLFDVSTTQKWLILSNKTTIQTKMESRCIVVSKG